MMEHFGQVSRSGSKLNGGFYAQILGPAREHGYRGAHFHSDRVRCYGCVCSREITANASGKQLVAPEQRQKIRARANIK